MEKLTRKIILLAVLVTCIFVVLLAFPVSLVPATKPSVSVRNIGLNLVEIEIDISRWQYWRALLSEPNTMLSIEAFVETCFSNTCFRNAIPKWEGVVTRSRSGKRTNAIVMTASCNQLFDSALQQSRTGVEFYAGIRYYPDISSLELVRSENIDMFQVCQKKR